MRLTLTSLILFIITSATHAQLSNQKSSEDTTQNSISESEESAEVLFKRLSRVRIQNDKKIQTLYFKEEEVLGYGGSTKTITSKIKNRIYKAGQILIEHEERKSESNEPSIINHLKEIIRVQDRLISLGKMSKTRPLEKKLKKLDTAHEIRPVFFSDF